MIDLIRRTPAQKPVETPEDKQAFRKKLEKDWNMSGIEDERRADKRRFEQGRASGGDGFAMRKKKSCSYGVAATQEHRTTDNESKAV